MANLETRGVRLVAENAPQFTNALDEANRSLKTAGDSAETAGGKFGKFGDQVGDALKTAGTVAVAGLAVAGAATAKFVGDSVKVAADFESNLNRFAAVSGDALNEGGASLQDFSALFLKMGADTQYSAGQAAEAAVNLAKGGLKPAEIAAGGLEEALRLAAAGELDLAVSAEIMAKQLGVWRDTGVQAADVATLLAQAANASTVDVDELALGLANVGGVAKVAGVTFQETVQTMALLSPGFSSAADAGTSLKTMLSRLIPQTKNQHAAMEALGLITEDGTSAFYDANGAFIGMEAAAGLLQQATKDLGEEEKLMALQTIFGQDAIRAAAILAEKGAAGFTQMGTDMAAAGTAAEQAALRQKGLNFAMETLGGSVETLQIVIGTALLPILADLVTNYITPAVNGFMQIAQSVLAAGDPVMALAEALEDVIPWGTQAVTAFRELAPALQPIGQIIGDNLVPVLGTLAAVAGTAVVVALGAMIAPLVAPIAVIAALAAGAVLLSQAWESNFLGIRDVTQSVMEAVSQVVSAVLAEVLKFWEANGAEIMAFVEETWSTIQSIIAMALQIINATIVPALAGIAGFISTHSEEIQTILKAAWTVISTIISTVLTVIQGVISAALQIINGDWEGAWETIKATADTVWKNIGTIVEAATTYVKGLVDLAWKAILTATETLRTEALKKFNELKQNIINEGPKFLAAAKVVGTAIVTGIVQMIQEKAGQIGDALVKAGTDAFNRFKQWAGIGSPSEEAANELGAPINEGFALGLNETADQVHIAFTAVADDLKAMMAQLIEDFKPLWDEFNEVAYKAGELLTTGMHAAAAAARTNVKSEMQGIPEDMRGLADTFKNEGRAAANIIIDNYFQPIADAAARVADAARDALAALQALANYRPSGGFPSPGGGMPGPGGTGTAPPADPLPSDWPGGGGDSGSGGGGSSERVFTAATASQMAASSSSTVTYSKVINVGGITSVQPSASILNDLAYYDAILG